MILPHEFDSCVNPDKDITPKLPTEGNSATPDKSWKILKKIEVIIEVPVADAGDVHHALQFARDLIDGLPLKVTLGDAPLSARFT